MAGRLPVGVWPAVGRRSTSLKGSTRQRWILVAAILGLNITILDETVVFLALPAINRSLGVGLSGQQWIVNGYLLSLSALLLLGGSLADLFGRRRMFLLGLAGFGLSSLACGLAPNGAALIAFRLVQGGAAAIVMPSTLALVSASFPRDERTAAIGSWASWGAVAAAIGPLVAGVLIQTLTWRAIFFLNLPLVAAAMLVAFLTADESRHEGMSWRQIDLIGALLAAVGLGGLAFALIQGPATGWWQPTVILGAIAGLIAIAAFLVCESRAESPLLPLQFFRSRNLSAANGATLALYAVFNGNFFILTIYLQTVLGYPPLAAGAATLPVTLLMIFLASRLGRLAGRTGPRLPMSAGILLTGVGLAALAFVSPGDSYFLHVLPGVLVFGFGLALAVPPLTTTAVSAVPDSQAGIASGINDEVARVAALLGVAVCGLIFAATFQGSLARPDPSRDPQGAHVIELARERPTSAVEIPIAPSLRDRLLPELRGASVDAYRLAMFAGALIALAGALTAFLGVRTETSPPTARTGAGP